MTRSDPWPLCRCGHEAGAHEHYREGDDCAICGRAVCPDYRPVRRPGRIRRALARYLTRRTTP